MPGNRNNTEDAEGWINGEINPARRLTKMGVTAQEVAVLGVVDNLPVKLREIADMVLPGGISDLAQVT